MPKDFQNISAKVVGKRVMFVKLVFYSGLAKESDFV